MRQHQIAQTQRRKGDLAEGADVQHPPTAIQGRQRRQRRSAVAVFTVVVVLDDPAILALCPIQQRQTPRQAHGDSSGVLVRRGYVTQATIRHVMQCSAVQALIVDCNTSHLCAGQGEGITGRAIAGVFHSHHITRLQQQLCTKANCLLCATGDHNLFSGAGKPA
ncbi:hypothetical protein D3C72_1468950 [compost metagenome]